MWLEPLIYFGKVNGRFLIFFHTYFFKRLAMVAAIIPMLVPVEAIMMRSAAVILWMALVAYRSCRGYRCDASWHHC